MEQVLTQSQVIIKRRSKAAIWLISLISIAGGALLFFAPQKSQLLLGFGMAAYIYFLGTVDILTYFIADQEKRDGWLLASGVINMLLGTAVLFTSGIYSYLWLMPYLIAGWAVCAGIVKCGAGAAAGKRGDKTASFLLTIGILTFLFGGAMGMHFLLDVFLLTVICSAYMVLRGVVTMLMAFVKIR